jgi:hypothetical protein
VEPIIADGWAQLQSRGAELRPYIDDARRAVRRASARGLEEEIFLAASAVGLRVFEIFGRFLDRLMGFF